MMKSYRREISVAIAIASLCAVLAVAAPTYFAVENLSDLFLANLPVLIVAVGMTVVILAGQIDISVGSSFAVCSVAAGIFAKLGLPAIAAAIVACTVGAALGSINGLLVGYVRIPSIVVTLATMVSLRAALRWYTQGAWIQDLPARFQWFGLSQSTYPMMTFIFAATSSSMASWILRNISAGRAIYAAGSNEEAARLAGIRTNLITISVFVVCGVLTGFAAVLNSVR